MTYNPVKGFLKDRPVARLTPPSQFLSQLQAEQEAAEVCRYQERAEQNARLLGKKGTAPILTVVRLTNAK